MAYQELKKRRRHHYPHLLEYRTRWGDNDMYSHLNNTIYYELFDSCANDYLIKHCALGTPQNSQIGMMVRSSCDYLQPSRYPATVTAGVRVSRMGTSSVTYEAALFTEGEEEPRAVGEMVHVYVDKESQKVGKGGMNEVMREGLEKLMKRQAKL